MLDASELKLRIRDAMENRRPERLTLRAVAAACGVTVQAVNGWRKTGRIAKGHLLQLALLTGKPVRYFLGEDADQSLEAQAFQLAEDWLSLTPEYRAEVRKHVDSFMDALQRFPELRKGVPDEHVARYISPATKSASVKREVKRSKP